MRERLFPPSGLALDPRLVRSRHDLAAALLAQGRVDDAISQFETILRISPDDQEAREGLARTLALQKGL